VARVEEIAAKTVQAWVPVAVAQREEETPQVAEVAPMAQNLVVRIPVRGLMEKMVAPPVPEVAGRAEPRATHQATVTLEARTRNHTEWLGWELVGPDLPEESLTLLPGALA
jgi:hypothetical protein